MQKDKSIVFKDSDYSAEQLRILDKLMKQHPSIKWKQLVSPFHCFELYKVLDGESAYMSSSLEYAFSTFGQVTVNLDYVLCAYGRIENTDYETALVLLRNKYKADGDALADILCTQYNIMHPLSVHVKHRKEIDYEEYILRDFISEDAEEWLQDYFGVYYNTENFVRLWNLNKQIYFKQLNTLPDDIPVD